MQAPILTSPELRQRAVAFAVNMAAGTALAPQRYECELLALYEAGTLTLDEVSELLDLSVYQVLYHSRARAAPTEAQLQELLAQSGAYNARHQITGLLLYSDGRFVQALEGAEADVRALYARIQRDPRHEQVVTVSAGPGPQRRFPDWSMGFGQVAGAEVDQALEALQSERPSAGHRITDASLQALLEAFGQCPPQPLSEKALTLSEKNRSGS